MSALIIGGREAKGSSSDAHGLATTVWTLRNLAGVARHGCADHV